VEDSWVVGRAVGLATLGGLCGGLCWRLATCGTCTRGVRRRRYSRRDGGAGSSEVRELALRRKVAG
jgi:hypothetical protein